MQTGEQQAEEDAAGVAEFVKFIRYFLLAFGGIALFVGAFVIFNTLSITVAQRTRELATLRTLGASRRQVLRSVVLEALVHRLRRLGRRRSRSASLLAKGLSALFAALDLDLPQSGTVFAAADGVVSLARRHAGDALRGALARRSARRASRRSRPCARAARS